MRYNSWNSQFGVILRNGQVTLFNPAGMKDAVRLPLLDPTLIGKALASHILPRLPFLNFDAVWLNGYPQHGREWEACGAPSQRNYDLTSVFIIGHTDGQEARFFAWSPGPYPRYRGPDIGADARLASRPPIYDPDNPAHQESAFFIACWKDAEMLGHAVLEICRRGGPPQTGDTDSVFTRLVPKRRIALHHAAAQGDLDALAAWSRNRKVDPLDSAGMTPLMVAAAEGHPDFVERLLHLGARPGLQDARGRSALHYAAERGDTVTVDVLLAAGTEATLEDEWRRTPLHAAADGGHTAVVEQLLAAGADPNAADGVFRLTPLHLAARGNHTVLVPPLLNAGAEVDPGNEQGRTPLHVAAGYGHLEMVRELIAAGGDVNKRDRDGETPLHRAVFYQHLDCIADLIEQGADVGAADAGGRTPLHVAAGMNRDRATRMLIGAGSPMEAADAEGLMPLDHAIVNQHFGWWGESGIIFFPAERSEHNAEVAEVLLKHGAGIDPQRLPLGDRHPLWPHLTPSEMLDQYGVLDYTRIPGLTANRVMQLPEEDIHRHRPINVATGAGTLLHDAVVKGMPELARRLLDSGAAPGTAVLRFATPLHMAAGLGNVAVAEMLLDTGADIEMPSGNAKDGRFDLSDNIRYDIWLETPLDWAIEWGQVEMVHYLLQRGSIPPMPLQKLRQWRVSSSRRGLSRNPGHPLERCPEEKKQEIIAVFEELGLPV